MKYYFKKIYPPPKCLSLPPHPSLHKEEVETCVHVTCISFFFLRRKRRKTEQNESLPSYVLPLPPPFIPPPTYPLRPYISPSLSHTHAFFKRRRNPLLRSALLSPPPQLPSTPLPFASLIFLFFCSSSQLLLRSHTFASGGVRRDWGRVEHTHTPPSLNRFPSYSLSFSLSLSLSSRDGALRVETAVRGRRGRATHTHTHTHTHTPPRRASGGSSKKKRRRAAFLI